MGVGHAIRARVGPAGLTRGDGWRAQEMIVVDDNSRDGSEEKINELGKKFAVRIIVRTKERGLSSAVMRGFDEARS